MMNSHIAGRARRRRMVVAAAATASVLMAVSAPVAAAQPGSGGTDGGTGSNHHSRTGDTGKPASKVSSNVKSAATTSTSGSQSTVLHNTSVNFAPKAAAAPTAADPGIAFGNPPVTNPGTNTDFGANTSPTGINIWNLGSNNHDVANNTGLGTGINVVNLANMNTSTGNQVVGQGNFGTNNVSAGSTNGVENGSVGTNDVNRFGDGTGSIGSNLLVAGDGNRNSGQNLVVGSNSIGENTVFEGNGNVDVVGVNDVIGNRSFASNLAFVGSNNFGTADQSLVGFGSPVNNSTGFNTVFAGNNNFAVGTNAIRGNSEFGANFAIVGDNASFSGTQAMGPAAANSFGQNWAVVSSTAANPTSGSGNNAVLGNNLFASNFAFVGAGSTNVGNNTAPAISGGSISGGSNFVIAGGNNTNVGNNTGGANAAIVGNNATNSGNQSVTPISPIATTFGGENWALVFSTAANPTDLSGNNIVRGDGLFGANFAIVGAGSSNSGNNISTATSGGFNLAVIAPGQTVAEGNNTGGGINIAILPTAAAPGNCDRSLCVNLFGFQLI